MGAESRPVQSGKSNEGGHARHFDGPQTEPIFAKMLFNAIDQRVALISGESLAEEFHHARIGVHRGKRFPVRRAPWTQADALAG
jgi:hypothetical protein